MTPDERDALNHEARTWAQTCAADVFRQLADLEGRVIRHIVIPRRFEPIVDGAQLGGYPVVAGDVDSPVVEASQ